MYLWYHISPSVHECAWFRCSAWVCVFLLFIYQTICSCCTSHMRFPRILNLMANLMCLASRSPKLPTGNRHPRVCLCVCGCLS